MGRFTRAKPLSLRSCLVIGVGWSLRENTAEVVATPTHLGKEIYIAPDYNLKLEVEVDRKVAIAIYALQGFNAKEVRLRNKHDTDLFAIKEKTTNKENNGLLK